MMLARVLLAAIFLTGLPLVAWAADDGKSEKKDTVDFRKLKELMPEKLGGLKRKECTGEKVKAGDFVLSMAKAEYRPDEEKDESPSIQVEMTDYAAAAGMAEGLAAWSKMEIDRDTDKGYEKTVKVAGNPGFETYNKEDKSGTLLVFVAQRFLVNVQAKNLPAEQTKKLAESLPLDKLAKLTAAK